MPGLGLWVWTMSGRRSRNTRRSSDNARTSVVSDQPRVAWSRLTWPMPLASSFSTYGPGADAPSTS